MTEVCEPYTALYLDLDMLRQCTEGRRADLSWVEDAKKQLHAIHEDHKRHLHALERALHGLKIGMRNIHGVGTVAADDRDELRQIIGKVEAAMQPAPPISD